MSHRAPVIGLPADSEDPGGYSKFPWYAMRRNYCSAIVEAGGVPLVLPHEPTLLETYAGMIDGLLVTGGAFDVDPGLFGEGTTHETVVLKAGRTDFELGLLRAMMTRERPILGICGGEQLLAVALGGTLIQHIPDEVDTTIAHEQPNPRDQAGHSVHVTPGTQLHDIVGVEELAVNSAHHQAVKAVPDRIVVNAVAPDGVIEGIEDPAQAFCIGVQWHPEFHITGGDVRLFAAFVEACRS